MSPAEKMVEELEASLQSRSGSDRLRLLRSVTDLFLSGAVHHSEDQLELFDRILCRLVAHVESRALTQLSAELAPIEAAPIQVVRHLARHDDIAISGPLLRESKRLETHDLVEIANTKSQAHLVAIGSRSQVEEAVTDVLIEKGNTEVATTIATNAGVRFSEIGFSRLVTRAESEAGLAELVAIRSEISPDRLRQLALKATDTVRQRLMAIANPETRVKIEGVLRDIAAEIDRPNATRRRDYSAAQRLVLPMQRDAALMKSTLAEAAEHDEFEVTVTLLSGLSKVAIGAVERLMINSEDGGILILCKAIGLDWQTVRAVLSLRSTGSRVTPAQMDKAFEQFGKLNLSTTQRIIRFWQVRTTVTDLDTQRLKADEPGKHPGDHECS